MIDGIPEVRDFVASGLARAELDANGRTVYRTAPEVHRQINAALAARSRERALKPGHPPRDPVRACEQEQCPFWSGSGGCDCAVFDISDDERRKVRSMAGMETEMTDG